MSKKLLIPIYTDEKFKSIEKSDPNIFYGTLSGQVGGRGQITFGGSELVPQEKLHKTPGKGYAWGGTYGSEQTAIAILTHITGKIPSDELAELFCTRVIDYIPKDKDFAIKGTDVREFAKLYDEVILSLPKEKPVSPRVKIYTDKIKDNPLEHDIFYGTFNGRETGPGIITYHGKEIDSRGDLRGETSIGLSWGNMGSSTTQTAVAILAATTNDDQEVKDNYQDFYMQVVLGFPKDGDFRIYKEDVKKWLEARKSPTIESDLATDNAQVNNTNEYTVLNKL